MKRLITALCFVLISLSARAQVGRVDIDMFGNYELTVRVGTDQYVTVDQYGQISYINIDGSWSFYDDFWAYQAGKVKRIGNVEFSYYDDFWDYKAGKIKKIGEVSFSYNDDFWDYKAGKLDKVGGMKINYHDDFWGYQAGKVKSLGNIKVDYYSGNGIGGNEMYKGLLKSINGSQYGYSRVTVRPPVRLDNSPMGRRGDRGNANQSSQGRPQQERPSPGGASMQGSHMHRPNVPHMGLRLEGQRQFEVGNVLVVVHEALYW